MKTTNLSALKNLPVWATLSPAFTATIREEIPAFSDFVLETVNLPDCRFDATNSSVIFSKPIKLDDIMQIYVPSIQNWIYLKDRPVGDVYGNVTLSSDGLTLTVDKSLSKGMVSGTMLAGYVRKTFTVADTSLLPRGVQLPADWVRPVFILDLNQIGDKRTYDGSFAVCEVESWSLANSAGRPTTCLWEFISELVAAPAGAGPAPTTDTTKIDQIKSDVAVLLKSATELSKTIASL